MKKWLVAIIIAMVLCLAAGFAAADDYLTITVDAQNSGTEIAPRYSGQYYYKICLQTNLDQFEMGWNADTGADEPDPNETYTSPVSRWYRVTGQGNQYFIITMPPAEGGDAMFYRIDENDQWKKIVFEYDRTKKDEGGSDAAISTTVNPSLYQEEYTVDWDAVNGADAYVFYWGREGEVDPYEDCYLAPANSILVTDERYGGPERMLGKVGTYVCWVDVLKGGQILTAGSQKTFVVEPELMLSPVKDQYVTENPDGSVTIPLNHWVDFDVQAPGAFYVSMYALDENEAPALNGDGADVEYDGAFTEEDGWCYFTWIQTGETEEFDKYITVVARYKTEDGENAKEKTVAFSKRIPVHVICDKDLNENIVQINGDIEYIVPDDVNTYIKEDERWEVAQDGRLFIDVDNTVEADFFGAYIPGAKAGDDWIADSHWVEKSNGNATRVPLTVPRCRVGGSYEVTVYAIKFGRPQKDNTRTIPIYVTDAVSPSPVILSMGSEFFTGEPLRVFAYYTNPAIVGFEDGVTDGALQIKIYKKNDPDNVVYEEMQGFEDFYDDHFAIWEKGDYVVEAHIFQYGEEVKAYPNLKEITVKTDGTYADLEVTPFTTHPAEQDLSAVLHSENVEATENSPGKGKADFFGVVLLREDGPIERKEAVPDQNGDATVVFDKDYFEVGGCYELFISAHKVGAETADEDFQFVAISGENENETPVKISLTDEVVNNEVLVNQDVTFRVEKKEGEEREIREVCLYDGNGLWNPEEPDKNGVYEKTISFPEGRKHLVYALVTFEERDEAWHGPDDDTRTWYTTNIIEMTATKKGEIGDFTFSVNCDINLTNHYAEAERGQFITVTYYPAKNADHYWIDVERYNEEMDDWEWFSHAADLYTDSDEEETESGGDDTEPSGEEIAGTASLPTVMLDAEHSYRIRATAEKLGYLRSYTEPLNLEITEPDDIDFLFTVDVPEGKTLVTGEAFRYSAYAPGADWIDIYFDYDNYDFERDNGWREDNGGGAFATETSSYGNSGEYTLVATAWYPEYDENNEPVWEKDGEGKIRTDENGQPIQKHTDTDSAPITLTVESADVEVEITAPAGMPAYIPSGSQTDLEFTVTMPTNADEYGINVWYDSDNGELYKRDQIKTASTDVTIPADMLPEGENCVHVQIRGQGYNVEANEKTWHIPVVPAADNRVILTIDGQNENFTIPVNTKAELNVSVADGADYEIETIYFYNEYGPSDHEGPDEDGAYTRDISFDNAGTFAIYAMVTSDTVPEGFDWSDPDNPDPREWVATNVVTVTVTKKGDVSPFDFELSADEAVRGEIITVTYTPKEDSEYDVNYSVDIGRFDEHGEWQQELHDADLESKIGGNATFSTAGLEPGTYKVRAGANAEEYVGYYPKTVYDLTVTEPENDGIQFTVSVPEDENGARTLTTGEAFRYSAYAPGADWIDVYFDYDNYDFERDNGWREDNGGGDVATETSSYGHSGEYTLVATAWYLDYDQEHNPIWETDDEGKPKLDQDGHQIQARHSVDSDEITLTVRATGGEVKIIAPEDLPAYLVAGAEEDLAFTVTKPTNADEYRVQVWYDNENGELYDSDDTDEATTVVSVAVPNEETWVHVKINGWGYNKDNDEATWDLRVKPAADNNVHLTLSGPDEGTGEIPVNKDARLSVTADEGEIKNVRVFNGDSYWRDENPDEDGKYERGISFGEEKTYTVYAMVTFNEWKDEYDGLDYDPRTWVYTDAVTVTATKVGDTGAFDFALSADEAVRGEIITVTYTPDEEADYDVNYWVEVGYFDENVEWQPAIQGAALSSRNGGDATFSTASLEAGTYVVRAGANAEGYIGYNPEETYELTVSEPEGIKLDVSVPEKNGVRALETGKEFRFSVYAPGADCVNVYFDYHDDNSEQDNDWKDHWDGDSYSGTIQYNRSGTYNLVAEAYYLPEAEEGEPIAVTTEPIVLTATATGGTVGIIAPQDLPSHLVAGTQEDLEFTVGKPEKANGYRVEVWYDDESGGLYDSGYVDAAETSVTVEANKLPNNDDNWVHVRISGWGYNVEEAEGIWDIPVVPASGTILRHRGDYSVKTGERIDVFAYTSGEQPVRVYLSKPNDGEEDPEPEIIFDSSDSNEFTGFAEISYEDTWILGEYSLWIETQVNDEWKYVDDSGISVEATAPYGELNTPTATVSTKKYNPGDNTITLTIGKTTNAEFYLATVNERGSEDDIRFPEVNQGSNILTLADKDKMEAGKIYEVNVGAFATGYISSWTTVSVACVDPNKVFQMVLPANLQTIEDEAFSGVEMQTVIVSGNNTTFNLDILSDYGTILVVAPDDANISEDAGFVRITPEEYSK